MSTRFSLAATLMLAAFCGGTVARAANADGFSLGASATLAEAPFVLAMQIPLSPIGTTEPGVNGTATLADDGAAFGQYPAYDVGISEELIPGFRLDVGYNREPPTFLDVYGGGVEPAFAHFLASAAALNSSGLTTGSDYVGSTVALSENLRVRFGESVFDSGLQSSGPAYLPPRVPSRVIRTCMSNQLVGKVVKIPPWRTISR